MKHLIHLTTLFLGLLLLGSAPVATKPTLFIIGDSTVKNGRGDGAGGLRGWGEKISLFLDTSRIEVLNHALGGTSSRTFITRNKSSYRRTFTNFFSAVYQFSSHLRLFGDYPQFTHYEFSLKLQIRLKLEH